MDLCAIILTKNEEKHIAEAVENAFQCADEVLVVDSGSTDDTTEIARQKGARVVFRQWDNDFSAQRNFALSQTKATWVLYLDADERMNEDMCAHIRNIVSGQEPGQYGMIRHMVFNGYRFHHGIFAPDTVYRLFPRDSVTWIGNVHEHAECNAPKHVLSGFVDHYTYDSWHQWLQKADYYTSLWAEERFAKGKRTSLASAFTHALFGTLRALLVKRAFLDGWMGVLSCGQHGFYTMLKYAKLYELQARNKEN